MNYTDEQKADILERVKKTKDEMEKIFSENQTSIGAYPVMVPTADGHFITRVDIQILDQKYGEKNETATEETK